MQSMRFMASNQVKQQGCRMQERGTEQANERQAQSQKANEEMGRVTFPQKAQVYLACWLTSTFFICLRREAP